MIQKLRNRNFGTALKQQINSTDNINASNGNNRLCGSGHRVIVSMHYSRGLTCVCSICLTSRPSKHAFYSSPPRCLCLIVESYLKLQSFSKCQDVFRNRFPDSRMTNKNTICRLFSRFQKTGREDDHKR